MSLLSSQKLTKGWEFKATTDSLNSWLPVARVPSMVHLDLMDNKQIPDPSIDMNELAVRWVGETSWTYRYHFLSQISSAPSGKTTALVFEGLDTFAVVLLNGVKILECDNMFIPYHIPITTCLAPAGEMNTLEIKFDSALLRAREIRVEHPEHQYIAHQGEPERIGVRKAQYHWGWDWGPKLMTAGPWRPVRLEVYDGRVERIWVESSLDENFETCRGTLSAKIDGSLGDEVQLSLSTEAGIVVFEALCVVDVGGIASVPFVLREASLWYPHGYGPQSRYLFSAKLLSNKICVHEFERKIGFRKAELIQECDEHGKSFYFRINGIDIFAGGSCWIPADNFIPRISPDRYRAWLEMMVEGNQIMTRIWGGGLFEEEPFYDICDELGILVWQDFLFACGSYPTFPSILSSIEEEARVNVRRLHHHPSVIIYAGNNEDYQIQEKYNLTYDYDTNKDPESWLKSSFPARYIYEHLLLKVMREENPGMVYHPSSPWGDGKHTSDPTVGDLHQWNVWHGTMSAYQNFGDMGGRFNSEFGMEAFPHMSTIKQFITNPAERYSQSLTMDFHNKADGHERRLATYVHENFKANSSDLKSWIHLTQLLQSESMSYAYSSWRRQFGKIGSRHCGGALVWQLNDCWPTISWAVVDYFMVKKPAFYTMSRALAPLAVGVVRTHGEWTKGHTSPPPTATYDLWVASSKLGYVKGTVELRFIGLDSGLDIKKPEIFEVDVMPNGTTTVLERTETENPPYSDAYVLSAKLVVNGEVISRDVDWPQPYKYLSFAKDRGLRIRLEEDSSKIFVTAKKPVKGLVWDEEIGLCFSDNALDIVPGETYVVNVKGLQSGKVLKWTFLGEKENERYGEGLQIKPHL